ncbi:MAG: type IV pilin protein [Nitrospinaceae bacterium]
MKNIQIVRDGVRRRLENAQGFTLIELLVVIAIIGVLSAIAIPQYNALKSRSYDANAKTDLKNVYTACKAYWADNGMSQSCNVGLAAGPTYGYIQSGEISIAAAGDENGFSGTAQHNLGTNSFTIDPFGNIS